MNNNKECSEELVAHVKATIAEDDRIDLEETATLYISSGSAPSILHNTLLLQSLHKMDPHILVSLFFVPVEEG